MKKLFCVFLFTLFIFGVLHYPGVCLGYNVIGEEDILKIDVWDHPELTVTVPVRPGGFISVPFLGDVKADGLTSQELKLELEKEFSNLIKTPSVSVMITAVNSFKIYILGAGAKGAGATETPAGGVQSEGKTGAESAGSSAGVISLKRDTSLIQLLALVGASKDVDLHKAYLMRNKKKLDTDFYKLVVNGDVTQDIQLQPNDVVYLPLNMEQRIKVVGAVKTPGIISYTDGMTALDAVLSVGGFTEFASQNNVVVIRKEGNEVKNLKVRLKDVINDGDVEKNLPLKPGDIVKVNTGIF